MENKLTASFHCMEQLRLAEGDLRRQGSTIDIRISPPDFEEDSNPAYSLNVFVEPSRAQLALDTIERYGGVPASISQE